MRLLHYSVEPFRFDPNREYQEKHWKPRGLWLSVEGEQDWRTWCEGENWSLEALAHVSEITLVPDANVLLIDTPEKLDVFNARFRSGDHSMLGFAWDEVKLLYDGVIIAPYQWSRRLDLMWYYCWDCASGVIWNLRSIADFSPACQAKAKARPAPA